jgi:DNA-directed RNA polymerase subunit K/omega
LGATIAKKQLKKNNNSIGVMTEEGAKSKGSNANVISMFGSVGQQFLKGKRLNFTLSNNTRSLAYFDPKSENIEAKGFIKNSYLTGLNAIEFFFIHTSGRENLIDTALKTQDTGTNQRHMMKAFENAVAGYDNSLRNIFGRMYNPIHNSGYNVTKMIKTVNKESKEETVSFIDLSTTIKDLNIKRGWLPKDLSDSVQKSSISEPLNIKNISMDQEYIPIVVDAEILKDENENIKLNNKQRKITLYEKTTLIGARAIQLSNNAKPLIDIGNEYDYIKIATMEYEAGVIPIYIIRKFTDDTTETIYPTLNNITAF